MKRNILLALVVFGFFLFSCKKNRKELSDYLPKIEVLSHQVNTDGSVTLRIEVDDKEVSPVEYVGSLFSYTGTPGPLDNQLLAAEGSDGYYYVTYSNLANSDHYYFKAFATNEYGYSSDEYTIGEVEIPPVTPPCTPTMNTYSFGTGTYSGAPFGPTSTMGGYTYHSSSLAGDIYYTFGSPLHTGIYTTSNTGDSLTANQCKIMIIQFNTYHVGNGGSVYVNETASGDYDVTVCSLGYQTGPTTFSQLTARFTAQN